MKSLVRTVSHKALSQTCPNCQRVHDISVYVSGQKLNCPCGIRFEVKRTDVRPSMVPSATLAQELSGASPAPPVQSSVASQLAGLEPTTAHGLANATVVYSASAPKIPGYELVELLGRGGMGEVWRAQQTSLGRMVAVKLLPPKLALDKEFVSRFEKETTALAALSHPNITQIIDRGVAQEHYYFAMELVLGDSLRDRLSKGRLAPAEALRIAVQVSRAMEHAHAQKIVHRDLKPENILMDAQGNVKVADFGLAGMWGSEKNLELTATSVAMGTVNYMAPEQRRDAKHVDHRADLYSLGVLLYEMLTGELPIGRFRLPSEKVRALDGRLDAIVSKALESEPAERYQSAEALTQALEPLISSLPSVRPPGRDTFRDRPVRSARATQFKRGALVLLGLAALGAAVRLWPRAPVEVPVPKVAPAWYSDSEDDLLATGSEQGSELAVDFEPSGKVELNAHAGRWRLEDGALVAIQYAQATMEASDHPKLVPRIYLSGHYYSADDFVGEVDMQVEELSAEFPPLAPDSQRYAELAFRIKDLQVSIFAIPGVGMRLMWRYFTPDGVEVVGNSARDLEAMVEDEMHMPLGRFRAKLKLSRLKNGSIDVEAFANGQRFVHKTLPGLAGQVGKLALGCRNLECRFDDLKVSGKVADRPAQKQAVE